jgi:hypothetical protein
VYALFITYYTYTILIRMLYFLNGWNIFLSPPWERQQDLVAPAFYSHNSHIPPLTLPSRKFHPWHQLVTQPPGLIIPVLLALPSPLTKPCSSSPGAISQHTTISDVRSQDLHLAVSKKPWPQPSYMQFPTLDPRPQIPRPGYRQSFRMRGYLRRGSSVGTRVLLP